MVSAMPEAQVKYMTDKIPMRRCGTEEVANLVAWIVFHKTVYNWIYTTSVVKVTY
jgi:3-oxoacyl-[acyl-carrier protein] reductase